MPCEDVAAKQLTVHQVQRKAVRQWKRQELLPLQVWPEQRGTVRGVLMSAGAQPWGGSIMWGGNIDQSPERTEYRFYGKNTSAYAVYFVSEDGRGFNPIQSWTVTDMRGQTSRPKVAMFLLDTPNQWGLCSRAHLIEAEARSLGANIVHFVIAEAKVLDGSEHFALSLEPLLSTLRTRFDRELERAKPKTEALVKKQRADVPEDWEWIDRQGTRIGALPSWDDDKAQLDVLFYAERLAVAKGPRIQVQPQCPQCVCDPKVGCAPCPRCNTKPSWKRQDKTIGWHMAVRYRVDARGRLLEERLFAPQAL